MSLAEAAGNTLKTSSASFSSFTLEKVNNDEKERQTAEEDREIEKNLLEEEKKQESKAGTEPKGNTFDEAEVHQGKSTSVELLSLINI